MVAFAAQIGLAARPTADGRYVFAFSRSGLLGFESGDGGGRVVISLTRPLPRPGDDMDARVLALAGPDLAEETFLHAGLTARDEALFALSIPESEFGLPAIERSLGRLIAAQDALG
ncbi:hypothetical protein [uncultured Aureimonas sp.]|uniref:hypothetical protein n=1 Tax=uncultured Aureimonas sp. TaxID=1604662 RepID=UPI0025E61B66|nr:hypothetical protein [uncultured Aureimonas sp.]